ncbi:MAG: Mrp/NBP35 family ATP-binding protein [Trueperaceae bacterium]|nr:Mrp/NBP35 family ATP-binding protein [Trueperaceae bacterium]
MTVEDKILTALKTVNDPELHQDLVSLGMVDSVKLEGKHAHIKINLTTPACPMKAQIEQDVRTALKPISELDRVELEFGSQVRGSQKQPIPGIKNIIAVGSGKGGVGKSTVAANIAASLALEGADVGLLDADIYGPSQAKMYSVEGKRLMADEDKNIIPLKNYGVKVISIANLVEDGQALTWRGPILHGTLNQMLNQTLWGELDYLVVDLPPGTGDVQLSLTQLTTITGALIVTTPQDMALLDVKRAYTMLRKTHVPVFGLIENMAYYQLPDGSRDYIFGEGSAKAWAESEKLAVMGEIPINRSVRESGDAGKPIVLSNPDAPESLAFRKAARALAGYISVQNMMTLPVL